MKHILFSFVIISVLITSHSACTSTEKVEKNSTSCSTQGTVLDLTGKLAGCKLLFQLDDETKLHPVEFTVEKPTLKDGQKIRFSYENADAMTNCMAGQTVKITCIELID